MEKQEKRQKKIKSEQRQFGFDGIFTSADITVWENCSMSSLINFWPQRCWQYLCSQSKYHIKTHQRSPVCHFPCATSTPACARVHSHTQQQIDTVDFMKLEAMKEAWPKIVAAQEGSGAHPWIWTGSSQERGLWQDTHTQRVMAPAWTLNKVQNVRMFLLYKDLTC